MNDFYPYQTQAVRDLAWACFAPPLLYTSGLHRAQRRVTDAAFALTPARRLWLEGLERDARPLLEHLAQAPSTRLGLYFERLWHFFLREDPEVELVAHNVPVYDGGRTLGEFDCLYFCKRRNTHVHLELAVKFYLGVPGEPAGRQWLGPNTRDRLDLKLTHLLEQQITLADRSAAQTQLESLGLPAPAREVALRGYLFQPVGETLPPPPGYNPQKPFATWYTTTQLRERAATRDGTGFRLLERLAWLAPRRAAVGDCIVAENLEESVRARFAQRPAPLLVAALDAAGEERERFFVVPPRWPASSASHA